MADLLGRNHTIRSVRRALAAASASVAWLLAGAASAGGERPNIVVLLSDNLGFGEIGAYVGSMARLTA